MLLNSWGWQSEAPVGADPVSGHAPGLFVSTVSPRVRPG